MKSNQVVLIGRLGQEPRVFMGGKGAELRLATSRSIKNKQTGAFENVSDWHTATVWDADAQYAQQYGQKGTEVLIIGQYVEETFTDKTTGQERKAHKVKVDKIRFLVANPFVQKKAGGNGQYNAPAPAHNVALPQGGYPQAPVQAQPTPIPQPGVAMQQPSPYQGTADDIPF